MSKGKLTKFERIQILRQFGLNTENSILVSSEEDIERQRDFLDSHDLVSVRTFYNHDTVMKPAHLPAITREEFFARYQELFEQDLSLIVAEQIDPKDAEFAGCILREGSRTTVEIVHGQVTVRRLTRDGNVDERYVLYGLLPHSPNPKINEALLELYRFDRATAQPLDHCNYEFSYYKIPVGWKWQRVIFWEITSLGDSVDLKL